MPWVRLRACEMVRDKQRAEINAEDDAGGGERAAASGDDDVRDHAVENLLHLRIGREKGADDAEHFVQLGGSVPKRPRRCQRKRRPGARVKRNW